MTAPPSQRRLRVATERPVPPHDLDAERAVLAAVLDGAGQIADVRAVLGRGDEWWDSQHAAVWRAVCALDDAGAGIDTVIVAEALRKSGSDVQSYRLAELIDATPAVANVVAHARIVAEHARKRREMSAAEQLLAALRTNDTQLAAEARLALVDNTATVSESRMLDAAAIFAPLPPIPWLCEGLDMCPGPPHLIVGYGFSGKTPVAQDLVLAVASGQRAWGTFAVRCGAVLHLDYEQGEHLTRLRYQRLAAARGLAPSDLVGLRYLPLPTTYLDSDGAEHWLTALARECALVVIDSLRAAAPGTDENSSDARRVLDMLHRVSAATGSTIVVIHHSRKSQPDAKGGARMAIRGSGALYDAAASVLVIERAKGRPAKLMHEKARTSGRTCDDMVLRIEDVEIDGNSRGGLLVTVEASPVAVAAPSPVQAIMPRVLQVIRAHPGVGAKRLRAEVGGKANVVDAAVEALMDLGIVEDRGDGRRRAYHAVEVTP